MLNEIQDSVYNYKHHIYIYMIDPCDRNIVYMYANMNEVFWVATYEILNLQNYITLLCQSYLRLGKTCYFMSS
jgi:hypothetical protein